MVSRDVWSAICDIVVGLPVYLRGLVNVKVSKTQCFLQCFGRLKWSIKFFLVSAGCQGLTASFLYRYIDIYIYQSEGGTPNGVMKLPGRVMARGVVPARIVCSSFFVLRHRVRERPATHSRPTRDQPKYIVR